MMLKISHYVCAHSSSMEQWYATIVLLTNIKNIKPDVCLTGLDMVTNCSNRFIRKPSQKPFQLPTLNLIVSHWRVISYHLVEKKHCKPLDLHVYIWKTIRKPSITMASLCKNITIASLLTSYTILLSLYIKIVPAYFQYLTH